MGLCKDCKHWDNRDEERAYRGRGVCGRVNTDPTYASGLYAIEDDERPGIDSRSGCAFITPPKYGCVLFEEKQSMPENDRHTMLWTSVQTRGPGDKELDAMALIKIILRELPIDERRRVLAWVATLGVEMGAI